MSSSSRTIRLIVISLFSTGLFSPVVSQNALRFEHLGVRDGLPDNAVTCTIQDQMGFMWFGTYKGVCRFDGYEFQSFQYDESNPNSLQGNLISCMAQDHTGIIWFGSSSNGVSLYDPLSQKFTSLSNGTSDSAMIADYSIRVIFEDSEHYVWVGTEYGLSVISPDRKTFKKYYCLSTPCNETINNNRIYDIAEDSKGQIWLATGDRELLLYNKQLDEFREINYTDLALDQEDDSVLKNILFQNDSTLWVASLNGGLARLNTNTLAHKTFLPSPKENSISSMQIRDMVIVDNALWLATDGSGIDIMDLESEKVINYQKSISAPNSLSSNAIWQIFPDRQGILWISTFRGGVNKFDPQKNYFKSIRHSPDNPSSIPDEPILSLANTPEGMTWVGTDWGGLHLMKDGQVVKSIYSDSSLMGLSTNVVKSLEYDASNRLLIGTYNFGLTVYDEKLGHFNHFKREKMKFPNLASNHIWDIYKDSRDLIWLGTLGGGMVQFHPKDFNFTKPAIHYPDGGQLHVYHIFEDSQSNLWCNTDGGLLYYHRRTNEWSVKILSELLNSTNHTWNQTRAVIEDDKRHVWIACAAGLIEYIPEEDQYITRIKDDGLPELPLINLKLDEYGNLIIVSKTHISQFDLAKQTFTNYQIEDNSFNYNAMLQQPNGLFWIGGVNGITYFDPALLRKNEFTPPVYITGFSVFNIEQSPNSEKPILTQSIETTEKIVLRHNQSVINFRYTALNYSETSNNQFAYLLEGFDDEWQMVSNRRLATYTNLDPGEYTFRVKAANNHGLWNHHGTSVKLVILPPFWATWWFRGITILAVICLLYLLQKERMARIRRKYEYRQMENEQALAKANSQNLKMELESTKNELNNLTMSYLHHNQKMQHVRSKITEAARHLAGPDIKWTDRIVREIDKEIADHDYWDKFEVQFNKSHDNFLERFKQTFPDLSKRELRICAYLRMGLSNHDIAVLMNVTLRTVEQSRYRIRKKINLEERQSFTKMILRF